MRVQAIALALIALLLSVSDAHSEDEDQRALCPLMSEQLVAKVAAQIKGKGQCPTVCRGCGCKGGPGFRAADGNCVGWREVITKCGKAPHAGCLRECTPLSKACIGHSVFGRVWLKAFAASAGLTVSFIPADPPKVRGVDPKQE